MGIFKSKFFVEAIKAILVVFLFIVVRYFIPFVIGDILFLIFLIKIYKTKYDYFWIPVLLFIFSGPGYLFSLNGHYHLPFIGLSGERGINYLELVIIVLFLKSYKQNSQTLFFY